MFFYLKATQVPDWDARYLAISKAHLDEACETLLKNNERNSRFHTVVLSNYRYYTAAGKVAHPSMRPENGVYVRVDSEEARILGVRNTHIPLSGLKAMAFPPPAKFIVRLWRDAMHHGRRSLAAGILNIPRADFEYTTGDGFDFLHKQALEAERECSFSENEERHITGFRNLVHGVKQDRVIFGQEEFVTLRSIIERRLDGRLADCSHELMKLQDAFSWLYQKNMHASLTYRSMIEGPLLEEFDKTSGHDPNKAAPFQREKLLARFGEQRTIEAFDRPLEMLRNTLQRAHQPKL